MKVENGCVDILAGFDDLPDAAFVGRRTVGALLGDVSTSTVWRRVKEGKIPQPRKTGNDRPLWNVGILRRSLGINKEAA